LDKTVRLLWEDEKLRKSVDIQLYPLYMFSFCERGESGCLGTLYQLCSASLMKKSDKHVPYALCMATQGNGLSVEKRSDDCTQEVGFDNDKIKDCVASKRSYDLLEEATAKSMKIKPPQLPWALINGEHTKHNALLAPICNLYAGHKPKICSTAKRHDHKKGGKEGCSEKSPCLFDEP
jgi:hypothetical protein